MSLPKGQICEGCPRFAASRCGVSATSGKVHVLFVGAQPDAMSVDRRRPFAGHGGNVVHAALQMLRKQTPLYNTLQVAFTYAVQCLDPTDTAPDKVTLQRCHVHLQSTIQRLQPTVIVAMGAVALKQLGFKQMFSDVQHKFLQHIAYPMPVYVSFSEKALFAAPGLFETFKMNLRNIFQRALAQQVEKPTLEALAENYRTPKTIEEAIEVCQEILHYTDDPMPLEQWPISVDTETNTLRPEKETSKIIAFCFGWGRGKAATILYDHPHAGDAYLARLNELWPWIEKVLQSKKPKILHNAKFDLKFIELRYNTEVACVAWDTLLGEHLLDEDKKGNYGLKVLTANFLPQYCGYEDKLHDLLENSESVSRVDEAQREIDDLGRILSEEHAGFLESLKEYKKELVEYERQTQENEKKQREYLLQRDDYTFMESHLAGLVAAWHITVEGLPKGSRSKPKKPVRWFKRPDKPPVLREPKKPKDPRSKKEQQLSRDAGFENIPLHDLQVYGAVDADVTRQLASLQKHRILTEKSKVVSLMKTHAIAASRTLGRMEYYGTRVDQAYIEVLEDALSKVVVQTEGELYGMAGHCTPDGKPLNLNGSASLANVLFSWGWTHPDGTRMDPYPLTEHTKKGQASTSEKTLRQFVAYEDDNKEQPTREALFIERLLRYRKASKALNTFLANVRALSKRDGFLHTQFHLNGTGTGRLSCVAADTQLETNLGTFSISDPALQDLLPHLKVRTHRNRWRRVTRIFLKGRDPIHRVTTATGETIKCTMDHRFLTPSGWKKLRELDVGAEIQTCVESPDRAGAACGVDRGQRDAAGSTGSRGLVAFRPSCIVSIEPLGVQEVWDLSVEEDASYCSQGVISHNSSDMNMQNVPKWLAGWNIKKLFIPDDDSYVIVNVDYKGAEVRVFTAYAADKSLIEALNEGLDMHSFFAARVFKRDYGLYASRDNAAVIPDKGLRKQLDTERSQIKRVVFGILYGAGPDKIAETIGISAAEATALIDLLYQMFPEIKRYAERVEREVDQHQYVETHFGRRRRFPLAHLSRHRGRAHRQARNFKIQSTSSDIVIGQLIEMDEPLRQDMGGRLLLTVHDSLVFQYPKRYLSQLEAFVTHYAEERVKQKYPWLPVPFRADIEVGNNYGECQSVQTYLQKYPVQLAPEGIVEENELLTELRNAVFDAA